MIKYPHFQSWGQGITAKEGGEEKAEQLAVPPVSMIFGVSRPHSSPFSGVTIPTPGRAI